jgi:hypothetical protein
MIAAVAAADGPRPPSSALDDARWHTFTFVLTMLKLTKQIV